MYRDGIYKKEKKKERQMKKTICVSCVLILACMCAVADEKPNVVLVMTDDQGWGETGYYNHPVLKTPNLDKMAANGLRFDRFYAGAPNCSPTRATVMTGRSNDRTGVRNHGYPLRRQEKTLAHAMRQAGYATGHFGKWHLNGIRGPGIPILKSDDHGPGRFGFDEWLSVTNFFDRDPLMSRKGTFVEFDGDSSEIIVDEALEFIGQQVSTNRPFFTVIWYGTPHSPFRASEDDKKTFGSLDTSSQNHYGELVAMDRSVGALRKGLRGLGVADNTIVWFCSDNGGLGKLEPETVGGLRGLKGTVFEGGLRVPGIVEWLAVIDRPRITEYPAATMDIFPTLADIVGMPDSAMLKPCDGTSIRALFDGEIGPRKKPIPFRHTGRAAFIDNDYKLLTKKLDRDKFQLYDLGNDPNETEDLFESKPEVAGRMVKEFKAWNRQVEDSIDGKDYPEKRVTETKTEPRRWSAAVEYKPYIEQFKQRPEYVREAMKSR